MVKELLLIEIRLFPEVGGSSKIVKRIRSESGSLTQTGGSQLINVLAMQQAIFSPRKKRGLGKRLAAASFFVYEDEGTAARVLHLGAFIDCL